MENLRGLSIKSVYRSGKDDLLSDFYLPALRVSTYYDRAVGFFSTSLIAYALKGFSSIVKGDGKVRLVVGYPLEESEFQALKDGEGLKIVSRALCNELDSMIENATSGIEKQRLKIFTLLVATNRLELKFALKKQGMYHEKIGILRDKDGNKILFHGSANETVNAIRPDLNFESIAVYKSWHDDVYEDYAMEFERGFESLWNGEEEGVITVDMPSELYEKINVAYRSGKELPENVDEVELTEEYYKEIDKSYPIIPERINGNEFKLFDHQIDALKEWYVHGCKGIFRLATGSGKTITAMYGAAKVFEKAVVPRCMLFIVSVPYLPLADQWVKELSVFNMRPIRCYGGKNNWMDRLNGAVNQLKSGDLEFASVVVVNKTLVSDSFRNIISRINPANIFFVGDECHRQANENVILSLPKCEFRMGLSATPYIESEDVLEDENVEKNLLLSYYHNQVAEFGLDDALSKGILTPYVYKLVPVFLTSDETDRYEELTKDIGRLINIDKSKDNVALANAVRKRNKIVSSAENKSRSLDSILKKGEFEDKSHTLFYVGEGSANAEEDEQALGKDLSQLEALSEVITGNDWKISKFTSLESRADRISIMDDFTDGAIDGLVSMRVLDEGIDIPQCKRAFILASSRNERQFIQRRGRILRRYKGKDTAEIYDFVVLPSPKVEVTNAQVGLVKKEFIRVMDFVRLAFNRAELEYEVDDIISRYGLDLREL